MTRKMTPEQRHERLRQAAREREQKREEVGEQKRPRTAALRKRHERNREQRAAGSCTGRRSMRRSASMRRRAARRQNTASGWRPERLSGVRRGAGTWRPTVRSQKCVSVGASGTQTGRPGSANEIGNIRPRIVSSSGIGSSTWRPPPGSKHLSSPMLRKCRVCHVRDSPI